MLILTAQQADAITAMDRARTDGGLGCTFDGTHYRCRDVRNDPAYAEYQDLLSTATPEAPAVTRLQARLALIDADLWGSVTAHFADPARTATELAFWNDAKTWRRDNPTLTSAATGLDLSEAQLDDLFTLAATL